MFLTEKEKKLCQFSFKFNINFLINNNKKKIKKIPF